MCKILQFFQLGIGENTRPEVGNLQLNMGFKFESYIIWLILTRGSNHWVKSYMGGVQIEDFMHFLNWSVTK